MPAPALFAHGPVTMWDESTSTYLLDGHLGLAAAARLLQTWDPDVPLLITDPATLRTGWVTVADHDQDCLINPGAECECDRYDDLVVTVVPESTPQAIAVTWVDAEDEDLPAPSLVAAYPERHDVSGSISAATLAAAVAQVAVAASDDDTFPWFTGVRIEIEGDTVTLAATDRYRFAVREFLWKPETAGMSAVALVPAKTLLDTMKSLTGGDTVTLALDASDEGKGLVGFEGAGRRTAIRTLKGDLPKYDTLFPTEFSAVAVIETAPFVEAVKRVALVAERNTPVRLTFEQDVLTLEADDETQATERLDACLEGDNVSIVFNPTFLLDGLSAIDSPVAQLSFTAPGKPALLSGRPAIDAEANEAYRYLITSMRLSN